MQLDCKKKRAQSQLYVSCWNSTTRRVHERRGNKTREARCNCNSTSFERKKSYKIKKQQQRKPRERSCNKHSWDHDVLSLETISESIS